MGYSTSFKGELLFTQEPTVKQLARLQAIFGEDCRDHKEWNADGLYYVDLELNDEFTGIRWNGAEKTYDLDKIVNVVINEMRKEWPDFGLHGHLIAQGEDVEDRWSLQIENGFAKKLPIETGKAIKCPHCGGKFIVE